MQEKVSTTAPLPTPWDSIGSIVGFGSDDQEFWWKHLAPVLGRFMIKAHYNADQQNFYLRWFHSLILPALGPRPQAGKERTWRAQLTPNASPFQPSWNLQNSKSTVRFTTEPIGATAGTREDAFNQVAAFELMRKLKLAFPKMEDSWFYHCAKQLYVTKDVVDMILAVKGVPKAKPPTCFLAFDLVGQEVETKAYFFPHMRAYLMGVTQGELVINTVKGLNGSSIDFNPSLAIFEEYLASGGPVNLKNVEMLAIDCIDPTKARVKIYVHSFNNSYNKIKNIYTMGGLLKDKATTDSLEPLKDLWRLLFDMPETGFEDTEVPNIMHPRSCFVFGFEFKSGEPLPVTKIYFPTWHYARTDEQISNALSGFFAKQQWNQMADSYVKDVQEIFLENDLANSPGTHQYLSFSAKAKSGLYVTMYYSPTIPHLTQRHEPCPVGEGNPMLLMGPPQGTPPVGLRVLQKAWPVLRWAVPKKSKTRSSR
ncbi:aromatic prenyltransferase [Coleophoma cylindrospora]|uniref:Aromatic prenyltransferase n=1 Tax=Coleophoma cylindrospora TaxID=1849047 RepID=A0A3D8QE34_9HELO|nr:aromatic prenyltransferase [Coleophoma cylindrospora]